MSLPKYYIDMEYPRLMLQDPEAPNPDAVYKAGDVDSAAQGFLAFLWSPEFRALMETYRDPPYGDVVGGRSRSFDVVRDALVRRHLTLQEP